MTTSADPFLEGYLPYVLRKADQTLSESFYAVLTRYGVARSEWRVLAVLYEFGDLSIVDLAAEALSPQPTVTHSVRRLEERSLVVRTPGTADKRQRFVSLTTSGSELTQTLVAEARRLERSLLTEVREVPALLEQLRELTASIEARTNEIAEAKSQD